MNKPKIGISSCLLGNHVRYDGGHKYHPYLCESLTRTFEVTPFCPEVGIGLPVPRTPIQLIAADQSNAVRAIETEASKRDFTDQLQTYADVIANQLDQFCGYIVKRASPSCGMRGVPVHQPKMSKTTFQGVGIFTARLIAHRPELPVEEEARMMEPALRQNFINRALTLHQWHEMNNAGLTTQGLQAFHQQHKQSSQPADYRELDQLLAQTIASSDAEDMTTSAQHYLLKLMQQMKYTPSN